MLYSKDKEKECTGYSDADWAGDVNDRKSTSGYVFKLSGAAISWRSKKQSCVALSTAEAEYIALASATQESVWLQELLSSMKETIVKPATIFEDNKSAICLAKNPQYHGRAKHIDIKHHFIRQRVQDGDIKLEFCKSEDMIADMLTKGLSSYQFAKLKPRLHYAINLKRFVAAFFTIYLTRLILQVLLFTLRRQMPVSPPLGNVFLSQRVLCSGITSVVLCLAYSMCI